MDPALLRGELDARATSADTVVQRNPDWLKNELVDFHAMIEVPKGEKHSHFAQLPDLENFAKSDMERKLMVMQRAFRVAGQPFVLPPGTPKERVDILQEAFRKTYKDPEFIADAQKARLDMAPLSGEELEKIVDRTYKLDKNIVEKLKEILK